MTIDFDSNKIPSREEREERVLELHFNQNKNYRQIAKEMKMSLRDIGEIVNRAKQEKKRQEHKSLSVQAYELFSKGKTPLQVSVILNIGATEVTHYYTQYLSLVQLDDITKIYLEFKGDVSYFVSLCKAAKAARMGVSQVINLLRIANNYLPSVQHRYEVLQKQNNTLESNLRTQAKEFQNLSNQITYMNKRLDSTDKKKLLQLAIFSLIQSMRNDPDKHSALVYHDNDNQSSISSSRSRDNNSNLLGMKSNSRQVILPLPPYHEYIIEDYKAIVLEEAEKLYNVLVDQPVCEVINERVSKQSTGTLPALPLEEGRTDDGEQD